MKRVLFLIDSLPGGGAEKVLVDIVENLDKSKFDITVMTSLGGGIHVDSIKKHVNYRPFFRDLKKSDNLLIKISNRIQRNFRNCFFKYIPAPLIHKIFIGNQYDIEIAFLEGHSTKIIGASTNKHSKKYAWVHTDLMSNNWPLKFYDNIEKQIEMYNSFDSIYCVSKQAKDSFMQLTKRSQNVFTFYNPVNEIKIRKLANSEDINFNPNEFNVITVGRLTKQKGYNRLLKVHKKLINEGIDYHLYILGEGEERVNLEKFISDNQLESSVSLLGFDSNPYKYMKGADLFVCSSRAEGYSLVVAESLILGVPVISTRCAGPCELLGDGKYGLIIDNNEESLYEGLKQMIMDKELYEHYKKQCLERSGDFKLSKTMHKLEAILAVQRT
ncbi:Probable poly(glycerol-phosphate) alpha-glucosyltransferase [Turicibacter sanguinis]|nr:Probable poly(glycerol-phosphate) alpha-glucosyltransferase [Turicibacter sanguinis]